MSPRHLTSEGWNRAQRFLKEQARPLEWHGFRHAFEGAPASDVIDALLPYRNDDGGFGQGLEPDVQAPASSAMATGMALRQLAELGAAPDHPLVEGATGYLRATLDADAHRWRVIPPSAQTAPHAPWWDDADGGLEARFGGYQLIPRALVVAALLAHRAWREDQEASALLEAVLADQLEVIAALPVLGTGGGSDLEYVTCLASAPTLPDAARAALQARVAAAVEQQVVRDSAAWSSYGLTPLRAAPHPGVPGAESIRSLVEAHIDWSLDHQSDDGSWAPTWSWGPAGGDAWADAERAWRGVLTLEMLRSLKAYGRLAGA